MHSVEPESIVQLREIVDFLDERLLDRVGSIAIDVSRGPVALDTPEPGGIAFCAVALPGGMQRIRACRAGAVLCTRPDFDALKDVGCDASLLCVDDPRLELCRIHERFFRRTSSRSVHSCAWVDADAEIGTGASVGPGAVVEASAVVGPECVIAPGAWIGGSVRLGARVVVEHGARLGGAGFGFARDHSGLPVRFPQRGLLVVGDDVEIGASATVDRGALGDTRIGESSKIDDGVYIAHNVLVGRACLVMAGAVLLGSARIGDGVDVAPGAIVREHRSIGDGARIGLGAVVVKDVAAGQVVAGVPAAPLPQGE